MGRLAELAKAPKLKGKIAITKLTGITCLYADEQAAEEDTAGMTLVHRRGAFYEVAVASQNDPVVLLDSTPSKASKKASSRRRKPLDEDS